jgi:hypothetical protein
MRTDVSHFSNVQSYIKFCLDKEILEPQPRSHLGITHKGHHSKSNISFVQSNILKIKKYYTWLSTNVKYKEINCISSAKCMNMGIYVYLERTGSD